MSFGFTHFVREEAWEIEPHNVAVGLSLLGTEQIVATLADKWTARLKVRINRDAVSAFRAWKTSRRGRLVVDQIGPVRELAGSTDGETLGTTVLHSDGTAHDDGTGYTQGFTIAAPVALLATTMTVEDPGATGSFDAGRFFGVAGRLYQITSLNAPVGTDVNFNFWPPMRTAAAQDDGFDFPPRTDMRLAEDSIAPVTDDVSGVIDVTIDLVEVP